MVNPPYAIHAAESRALWLSTAAYTVSFAAWTLFSIIGVQIERELGLTGTEFGLLVAMPMLVGSVARVLLGVAVERYAVRFVFAGVMIVGAVSTFLLSFAATYPLMLVAAFALGIVGGAFVTAVAHVSQWYPTERQSRAFDVLGIGIAGAAVTHVFAPALLVAHGWRVVAQIWAVGLLATAAFLWFALREHVDGAARGTRADSLEAPLSRLAPLKNVQVWRFALYYFFVFGAFVALVLWLPRYVMDVYRLDIETAGAIAAIFSLPAGLCRFYGGALVRDYGARRLMYWTLSVAVACTFVLSYPAADYVMTGARGPIAFHAEIGVVAFTAAILVLGAFMSFGQAAVFEHIPVYYPKHVAVVGGLVGMIGGLGGFALPIAFGILADLSGVRQSCFMLLFALVSAALIWMHIAIRHMEREKAGAALGTLPELPEMEEIHHSEHEGALGPRALRPHPPINRN
ncbi:MAG: NarK/NasA family nitrate transporter [Hyphomicrobiaceae bacterium]|nr:MAG: NarK/NasA family nitrate transporter [Hyphomicrobiaceae bacterium]